MFTDEEIIVYYLTWKIKIQLLAMQINTAKHEGVKQWQPTLLTTITEMHDLAVCYGPFDYQIPPVKTWPPYLARPVSGDTLFEKVSMELTALFGSANGAPISRIKA